MKQTYLKGVFATDDGQIYAEETSGIRSDGVTWKVAGRFRKLTLGINGYYEVRINRKLHSVHRLVCSAFHYKASEDLIVNHKDSDRGNNHYTNLEWVTYYENNMHSLANTPRTTKTGANGRKCKLTLEAVAHILENSKLEDRISQRELGDMYGVTQAAVSLVVNGVNWSDYENCSI